jgi:rRNA maturation RNase YbeY
VTKPKKVNIIVIGHNKFIVNKKLLKIIIEKIISDTNKVFKRLYIYFVDSEKLLDLNKNFLNHKTDTDIITFSYSEFEPYEVEIYISFEMAFRNAQKFYTEIGEEIVRLIIHGILHTIGMNDKTTSQKTKMRVEEDRILSHVKDRDFIRKMDFRSAPN